MSPPSERRFPRLSLAKAAAGASPGAAVFLEDLIDACVIESGESMKEEGSSAVEYPAFFHPSTLRSASSSVSPAQSSPS